MEILKGVPNWFLFIVIFILFSGFSTLFVYFLWSMKGILSRIESNTKTLFQRYDNHESRISKLEGKCETNHA